MSKADQPETTSSLQCQACNIVMTVIEWHSSILLLFKPSTLTTQAAAASLSMYASCLLTSSSVSGYLHVLGLPHLASTSDLPVSCCMHVLHNIIQAQCLPKMCSLTARYSFEQTARLMSESLQTHVAGCLGCQWLWPLLEASFSRPSPPLYWSPACWSCSAVAMAKTKVSLLLLESLYFSLSTNL